jgi:hypothetical protein
MTIFLVRHFIIFSFLLLFKLMFLCHTYHISHIAPDDMVRDYTLILEILF